MSWFKPKRPVAEPTLEVIAHKEATKEVVERAKRANDKLKELFDEDGFTIKIVLAMGAKQQTRKGGK